MSAVNMKMNGGARFQIFLAGLQARTGNAKAVRIGFLESATYAGNDGGVRLANAVKRLTTAQKTAHPDWEPRMTAWSKWQATHQPKLYVASVAFWNEFGTSTAPARPAFRNMISAESGGWGDLLGTSLKSFDFDANRALKLTGIQIEDQLKDSIGQWPADNADLTVHIKQFNRGLSDSGQMIRAVDSEVVK